MSTLPISPSREPVRQPVPSSIHPPAQATVLAGRGLVKTYGPTVALAGVGIDLAAGDSVAIMGPSGSGKSTLLHVLAGILKPDQGDVWLGSRQLNAMSERERTRVRGTEFGFVFQFGQLLPELPSEENVALPLMLAGRSRAEAVQSARGWFPALGIGGLERRRPGEISGGQAQRVAVARALVASPQVVFADEPTGALDQATGQDVMQVLVNATRASGAALLVVTHDPQVAAWCSRIVEVRDGLIASDQSTRPSQTLPTTPGAPASVGGPR